MDLSELQTWKDGVAVVLSAPHIVVPALITAAGAGWWLKAAIGKGENAALKERLQLAREREADAKEKQTELEKQVQELKARTAAGAPREELAAISARVDVALGEFTTANNAVKNVLAVAEANGYYPSPPSRRRDIPAVKFAKLVHRYFAKLIHHYRHLIIALAALLAGFEFFWRVFGR